MTPEQFCYWLQGFAELSEGEPSPDSAQWQMIKDHLGEVFNKVTPPKKQLLTESPLQKAIKDMQEPKPYCGHVDPYTPPSGRIC
jgi:hypothetical protein